MGADPRIVAVADWLPLITRIALRSHSGPDSCCGWNGHGEGAVSVERAADGSLIFRESGTFTPAAAPTGSDGAQHRSPPRLSFGNVLRWSIDNDRIALAHQRFGASAEVALVDLVPAAADRPTDPEADLVSATPHLCGQDGYEARLRLVNSGFDLIWRITGPAKDETLVHAYRR